MHTMATVLKEGAAQLGCPLEERALSQFETFMALLLDWNTRMNLTAITDPKEVVAKHFLDSLTILPLLGQQDTLIDVGTGAGFPGIPLKIARPSLEVTLMDALNKRITFLQEVANTLNMANITCLHSRAEDAGVQKSHREVYDVAVSRAVAHLSILAEYCLPFVKTGGKFISMKGAAATEEIHDAKAAIMKLGGEVSDVVTVQLPFTDITHSLVVISKLRQTPAAYPRKSNKIAKSPLK